MEMANGFHYALAQGLWAGPWGESTRKRSEWFADEIADLLQALVIR
jgi:hypothetical protein